MIKFIKRFSLLTPWDQKIAFILSRPFIFFRVHPNIVTFVGILLGLVCFLLYSTADFFLAKIASIIFFFAACFDHVDGEVARQLKKTSIFGHYFDNIGVTQEEYFELDKVLKINVKELYELNNRWYNNFNGLNS